jgi:dUTP pyrophosphatase
MNIDVKIKLLRKDAVVPVYATPGSAAADLRACIDAPVTLNPGEIASLPTGIAISAGRSDITALIYGRSGLGTKYGVTLANSVGVIDSDYRGEI